LMSTRSSSEVTLSLHPDTLEDLGDSLQRMLRNECKPETVRLTGDVSLDRHDVCISQSGGRIQAGMLAQLEQLGVLLSR
jgi:flagellar biosynthesis/type III secretory pathway protein FliH